MQPAAKKQSATRKQSRAAKQTPPDPSMTDNPLSSTWWLPRFYSGQGNCVVDGDDMKMMYTSEKYQDMQDLHPDGAQFLDSAASPKFPFFSYKCKAEAFGTVGMRPFHHMAFIEHPGPINIMTCIRQTPAKCPCEQPMVHSQTAAILLGELYFVICNAASHYPDYQLGRYIPHEEGDLSNLECFAGSVVEKWRDTPMKPWLELNFPETEWGETAIQQMVAASSDEKMAVWERDPFTMRRALQMNRWYHRLNKFSRDGYIMRSAAERNWEDLTGKKIGNNAPPKDCLGLHFGPVFKELQHGDWKCINVEADPKEMYPPPPPAPPAELEPVRIYPDVGFDPLRGIDNYFTSKAYWSHPRHFILRKPVSSDSESEPPAKHIRKEDEVQDSIGHDLESGGLAEDDDMYIVANIPSDSNSGGKKSTKTLASVHFGDEKASSSQHLPSSQSGSEHEDYEIVNPKAPEAPMSRADKKSGMLSTALKTISNILPSGKQETHIPAPIEFPGGIEPKSRGTDLNARKAVSYTSEGDSMPVYSPTPKSTKTGSAQKSIDPSEGSSSSKKPRETVTFANMDI